jgi:Flp pilus assembly protein TadG
MHFAHHRTRKGAASRLPRGQSLVEFAIVLPVLLLIIGAIIQFGVIFWGQNTLTQIARDTGRWASTQSQCDTVAEHAAVLATAKSIAASSSLIGPNPNGWTDPANVNSSWQIVSGTCPPADNTKVSFVTISITHQVPVFFPWIPGNGNLTTIAQFRMEPHP